MYILSFYKAYCIEYYLKIRHQIMRIYFVIIDGHPLFLLVDAGRIQQLSTMMEFKCVIMYFSNCDSDKYAYQ